jgi:23S rRNA (adenine-N6)-dimethyltransferase
VAAPPSGWEWHELDAGWAARLVNEAAVPRGSWVVDVGAGTGAITGPLLAAGARVIAVEADPGRAFHLRDRFGDAVVVVRADARDLRLPRRPFHVVSNPPFAVTSTLLRRLLQSGSRLISAHLVLQDQAARRWAGTGAPGFKRWSAGFQVTLGRPLPRSAFRPEPRVPTRVLIIERRAPNRLGQGVRMGRRGLPR